LNSGLHSDLKKNVSFASFASLDPFEFRAAFELQRSDRQSKAGRSRSL